MWVKGNYKTIGVSAAARYNQCNTTSGNEVTSVMNRAKKAGGLESQYPGQGQVQRPRWPTVTSATLRQVSGSGDHLQGAARLPSRGLRAHTVNRNWYSDADLPADAQTCRLPGHRHSSWSNLDIDVRHDEIGAGLGRGVGLSSDPRQPTALES